MEVNRRSRSAANARQARMSSERQVRKIGQDLGFCHARGKVIQDIGDCNPKPRTQGLPPILSASIVMILR